MVSQSINFLIAVRKIYIIYCISKIIKKANCPNRI